MDRKESLMTGQPLQHLSRARYAQAREYLLTAARPLEAALFRHRFEDGGAEAVYAELARFQNPDGGFGHALEPDLRTPASSVLATTTALQRLRMLHTPAQHPLVAGALRFLVAGYDDTWRSWPLVPRAAEDAPHAPWWNQEGLADRFGGFAVNPRAEVLGYLHEYAADADAAALALRDRLTPLVYQELIVHTDKLSSDAFLCCQRLVDSPGLPATMAVEIQRWLLRMAETAVATDPSGWTGYVLLPLQVAPNRAAPLGIPLSHILPENLDFVVDSQLEDGSWSPTWSWFGAYPDDWPQAERDWRGVLTLERLEWLHAYDRIQP
jgi:hypothetical protein